VRLHVIDYLGLPDVSPDIGEGGIPLCSNTNCPAYDGKRCKHIGARPDRMCEPAVAELVRRYVEAPRP
jgi:hypothetical protein